MWMIDRKKVIKALEVCSSISDGKECPKECPYRGQDMYCIGSSGLMLDAADLLKEQEDLKERHEILGKYADKMIVKLKESKEQIDVFQQFIEQMPNVSTLFDVFKGKYVKVIRCKDCKNAVVYDDKEVICTHIDNNGNDKHSIDWFCADGERREENESKT